MNHTELWIKYTNWLYIIIISQNPKTDVYRQSEYNFSAFYDKRPHSWNAVDHRIYKWY